MRTPLRRIVVLALGLSAVATSTVLLPPGAAAASSHTAVATSQVAVRAAAGSGQAVLGTLLRGQRVTAVGRASKGWVPVRFDAGTAYVSSRYLSLTGAKVAPPARLDPVGIKITTATLNLRSGPGAHERVVTTLAEGSTTTMTGRQRGGYAEVYVDGQLGWVIETYLVRFRGSMVAHTSTRTVTSVAHVRVGPSPKYRAVRVLSPGATVAVTGAQHTAYAQVIDAGQPRWVALRHLTVAAGAPGSAPVPTPTPGPVPTPGPTPTPVPTTGDRGAAALAFAVTQLGKPYRYGAVGPGAYDCSGLVLAAWRSVGITLPRTSQQQFRSGGTRIDRANLRPGDLVFFYGPSPHHVGMFVGGNTIINAPRPGRNVSYTTIGTMPYAGAVRPG